MKNEKVLVMCTGNSCRSIIAQALINAKLDGVEAFSCGVSPSGEVNINAQKILKENGIWSDKYHSKHLDEVIGIDFDLIVTVCDHAKESCPTFPNLVPKVHISFEDPDGKDYQTFIDIYKEIEDTLLPKVQEILKSKDKKMNKNVFKTNEGVKINFTGAVKKQQIVKMVENCATGQCECMSDDTKKKITNMQVAGSDGNVELNLSGEIEKEEIEKALLKSTVLNP